MQSCSRSTLDLLIRAAARLVPDVFIGIAVSYFTSSGLVGVFATVVGLQILYVAIWIKNTAWGWVIFRISSDREELGLAMLDFLNTNRFPEPDEYFRDVRTYFQSVINNPELPAEQRVRAAVELTAAQSMAKFGGGLRLQKAWNEAIEKYRFNFVSSNAVVETPLPERSVA